MISHVDWEMTLNKSRKPFIIYFRSDHYFKTCSFTEPVEFLQIIRREFNQDIDFYKVDKINKGGAFESDLFSHLIVEDLELPFFIAFNFNGDDWIEAGRVLPNQITSGSFGEGPSGERFDYNEIYNLCVRLVKGKFL